MLFNGRVELQALDRQSWRDGYGSWCAMCGAGLWHGFPPSVPRIPVSKGGDKKSPNCIMVCKDCFSKIENPGKEIILWEKIPYYNIAPADWNKRRLPKQ
jgi:hypothetical protein